MKAPVVFAIAAHPDDIEFMMGGTLLLLGRAGCELHYMTLSSGSLGSSVMKPSRTRAMRRKEAREGARRLGATWHPSIADDLAIFYEPASLRRLAAVIREVKPGILLTHSPADYMEDHTNTCRLAVTAAFSRGMPNFRTQPSRPPVEGDVVIYHAMPHMLRDPLGWRVIPEIYVNIGDVLAGKRHAAAAHESQKEWLDVSQGMDSYLQAIEEASSEVGKLSKTFRHGEGWRRHLHVGFCAVDANPLLELLGRDCRLNPEYARLREAGRG